MVLWFTLPERSDISAAYPCGPSPASRPQAAGPWPLPARRASNGKAWNIYDELARRRRRAQIAARHAVDAAGE